MENEKVEVTLLSNEVTIQTETLDKLYLEWSQFTKAKTSKEIELQKTIDFLEERIIDFESSARYINEHFSVDGPYKDNYQNSALRVLKARCENKTPLNSDLERLRDFFDEDIPF